MALQFGPPYLGHIGKSFGGITQTMGNHYKCRLISFIFWRDSNDPIACSFGRECRHAAIVKRTCGCWDDGGCTQKQKKRRKRSLRDGSQDGWDQGHSHRITENWRKSVQALTESCQQITVDSLL